ncbi:uncharacterized protein V1510DRAFT_413099 [Dipodascopsis tothii]|uniref:uncharacterized protein n=1 Tax=Dipodascopsis tothii TaxID=44089 RepID=UPI0034CD1389
MTYTEPRVLVPGVYTPTLTFFKTDTEDVDVEAVKKHAIRLARAGVAGIVTMGSNGEAVHLSDDEKKEVTQATRSALDAAGFPLVPIIAGVSQQSVRATLKSCHDAAEAGADAVLLLAPAYYRFAVNNELVIEFFTKVADKSPLPIIIYNFPGVVAGLDLDSDLLISLSQHKNIIGTKFTCGNTGKLARVTLAMNAYSPLSGAVPTRESYYAFAGMADFLVQGLAMGGCGVISGAANLIPRSIVRVYELYLAGKHKEAEKEERVLSESDWILTKIGLWGAKQALQHHYGYGGHMRSPGKKMTEAEVTKMLAEVADVMKFEQSLE